jgi:hypothetical protein
VGEEDTGDRDVREQGQRERDHHDAHAIEAWGTGAHDAVSLAADAGEPKRPESGLLWGLFH